MPRSCLETCSHTWPTRTATIFEGRKRTASCKECRPPRPDRHDFSDDGPDNGPHPISEEELCR
jgi:hypothetical protein